MPNLIPMPLLNFDEIKNWQQFEELTATFFRYLKSAPGTNIIDVQAIHTGIGADDGVDILVQLICNDGINTFTRRWIIQCKFTNKNVSPKDINSINIPSLLNSQGACGYLLVCKEAPTSGLTTFFDNLRKQNKDLCFEIWSGEFFRSKLILAPSAILQQYFPNYWSALMQTEKRNEL